MSRDLGDMRGVGVGILGRGKSEGRVCLEYFRNGREVSMVVDYEYSVEWRGKIRES